LHRAVRRGFRQELVSGRARPQGGCLRSPRPAPFARVGPESRLRRQAHFHVLKWAAGSQDSAVFAIRARCWRRSSARRRRFTIGSGAEPGRCRAHAAGRWPEGRRRRQRRGQRSARTRPNRRRGQYQVAAV